MDYRVNAMLLATVNKREAINYSALKEVYLDLLKSWCRHYYQEWYNAYQNEAMIHVLLLHANDLNALYLKDIIIMLRDEGWDIVSPEVAFNDEITSLPLLSLKKPTTLNIALVNARVQEAQAFTATV
jgi:hypothetical protein